MIRQTPANPVTGYPIAGFVKNYGNKTYLPGGVMPPCPAAADVVAVSVVWVVPFETVTLSPLVSAGDENNR